jgi:UDP-4-amino-4,6-dideoxy-N-acetyl-beta-L-altrosamine N-acetyltransferase
MTSFRPLQREDKETIRLWRNLPHIRRYMLTDHVISPEEHAEWFERVFDNPRYRHWIIGCDGEEVGLLDLYDIDPGNRRCYWGFYVAGDNVRGKNVGMFAEYFVLQHVFHELQFNKLSCEVLDFNRGVLRLHQAFGFVQEGRLRRHIVRGEETHDVICLGILKSEWEAKRPEFERMFRSKGLIP